MDLAYLCGLVPACILLIFYEDTAHPNHVCNSSSDLFILGSTSYILVLFSHKLRKKRLEIDDRGARFFVSGKPKWELSWPDMESVISCRMRGRYPRIGFAMKAGEKYHHVNDRDHLGTKEELKEAFRILVKKSAVLDIPIEDENRWAQDIIRLIPRKVPVPDSEMEGRWYDTLDRYYLVKSGLKHFVYPVAALGVLLIILSLRFSSGLLILGVSFLLIVILALVSMPHTLKMSMTQVWFDSHRLKMRFAARQETSAQWSEIIELKTNPERGHITVSWTKGMGGEGKFPQRVCSAVGTRFALSRFHN